VLEDRGVGDSNAPVNSLSPGCEVYNNYGYNKGNEDLLMAYGFATYNNRFDCYGLRLSMRLPPPESATAAGLAAASTSTVHVGLFRLRRTDNPDVVAGIEEAIPTRLWRALSDPTLFAAEERMRQEGLAEQQQQKLPSGAAEASVEVAPEDVDLLLATVAHRLQPFTETADADRAGAAASLAAVADPDACHLAFAHRYRDGQRRVLESIAGALEAMLAQLADASESEGGSSSAEGEM
jgi:hypothetical protein